MTDPFVLLDAENDDLRFLMASTKSDCCGAPIERRNDGNLYCSECGKIQGK